MKSLISGMKKGFLLVFGEVNWSPPIWLQNLSKSRKSRPIVFWTICVAVISIAIGFQYYMSLPNPVTIKADIERPAVTSKDEGARPQNLFIDFNYDFSRLNSDQERPTGQPSIARIDLVGQQIASGVKISPVKKGKWLWLNDRRIQFEPESDWPAGTQYSIEFEESIFITGTRLSEKSYSFTTPDLAVSFSNIEFYQDPQNNTIRRVASTLQFSHPVDKTSLEANLSMQMRPSGSAVDKKSAPYIFEVNYSKNQREVYILSEPVVLPEEPNYMKINLKSGVTTILGGTETTKEIEEKVLIPDVYSYLKIVTTKVQIVKNQKGEPEQILMLEFTDEIEKSELLEKLSAHILPARSEISGRSHWKTARDVSRKVLVNSTRINLQLIPNERNSSKLYSFKLDLPERRYLYMRIAPELTSVNNFIHASFYDTVLKTPLYPKEVDISGDGSILTYSGDHKLSTVSRGVNAIKYRIGRLLDGQLYHLISQSRGDMKNPQFNNWSFNSSNISEFAEEIVDIRSEHPKLANYSSLDLSKYLPQNHGRFGLFFIEAKGWNRSTRQEVYGVSDRRLILVTDLGIIVKNNADASHNVFVQSIKAGQPVTGAVVELLGKNGIALFTRTTSADGHVKFPSTRDYRDEKFPTVYVVKTTTDTSFIPFGGGSRQVNLSRFDIGGVRSDYYQKNALNAYAFTDRGIYRPGEEVNIGFVVKNVDLSNVAGIPLEVVVHGPRNNEVKVEKIMLPQKGFFDFQYTTDPTSDTGRYKGSIHLIRDKHYRGREIGSVRFTVEEFQPDTMKISSRLNDVGKQGWSTKRKIMAKTVLKNLFGTPAQNRKMTGRIIITPANFWFKEFKNFTFADPFSDKSRKPMSVDEPLQTQETDIDGVAEFEIDLLRFKEGTYNLQFIAEGFEQGGGRSVVASNSVMISPLQSLVGYKADGKLHYINANSKRTIEFISIDKGLKKISQNNMMLKHLEIQHISTLVKQKNGTFHYQTVKKEKELSSNSLDIPEDSYNYTIDTTSPGDYAIEIYDTLKRRLSRVEFSVVGVGNLAGKLDKKAELQLKLNKADYFPGEAIEMNILAPYAGAGLISIETDKVHHFKWFKTETESSLQTIRVPEGLEGTAYVNVTFVRDFGSKEIFTSPLSYAVEPFSIDRKNRELDIDLKIKEIVRPGKPMDIVFRTATDSKIVVFAVDEGIHQVAQYTTPAPLDYFLKKRSLDVETLQILDLILPDFNILRQLSASGGGSLAGKALAKNLNPFARKTDKPAVYWSGIVNAGPEEQHLTFHVPDTFAGSLKVIAVAVGHASMGVASGSTLVRGPFVISPNVLTQAAPGDEFIATIGVANIIEGSGKSVPIDVKIDVSEHLELLDPATVQLKIDEGNEGQIQFRLRAKKILGSATLTTTTKHMDEVASRSASLSVRPAIPFFTSMETGFVENGEIELTAQRSLYPDLASQSVAASTSPLVLVDGLTSYLKNYPHGCTEQVVSKVFPLVGLTNHPAYAPHIENVKSHFSHVIDKLRERQLADGGFAFWPGAVRSAEYPTIYVMHFLIEAHELGYPVPTDMLQRGKAYLASYAERSAKSFSEARDRANAIYLLTLMDTVTTNFLVDLQEDLIKKYAGNWQEDITASYMAATYSLLQKDDEADSLISAYKFGQKKNHNNDDFHSDLSQDAQHLLLLSKHFPFRAKALSGDVIVQLTGSIFKGEYNTISSAYSILALGAYSRLTSGGIPEEIISFSTIAKDGTKEDLHPLAKPFLKTQYPVNTEKIKLQGEKQLFYLNSQSGFDKDFPKEALHKGIEINRQYLDDQGNTITSFEQGKEINVLLKIRALEDRYLTNIAIIDLLPGGFEVVRSSVQRKAFNWQADYIDIREDRVVFYGAFDSSVKELGYRVKLTAAGQFVIPPSYAESMYDRSIRSISKAAAFTVTVSR